MTGVAPSTCRPTRPARTLATQQRSGSYSRTSGPRSIPFAPQMKAPTRTATRSRWPRWTTTINSDGRTHMRASGRADDEMREVAFTRDYTEMADGVALVEFGRTRVLCTASIETRVPPWLGNSGRGGVTAEYSMLPGSSPERVGREAAKGKQSGRTQEIQRLIGRAPRAVCDMRGPGGRQGHLSVH